MTFGQAHYNEYRQAGGDHAEYVAENDVSKEVATQLLAEYEKTYPDSVPEERKAECRRSVERKIREAQRRDEMEWLLGRGYYSQ